MSFPRRTTARHLRSSWPRTLPSDSACGRLVALQFCSFSRLWGEAFLDPATRTFKRKASECDAGGGGPVRRTFVEFVLLPLYRMYAACLGEEERDIERTLRGVGVLLSRDQLRASARPLLRAACRRFFGPSTGLVDMVVRHW